MRTLPPLPNEAQPKENTHPVHNGTIEDAVKLPAVTKTSQLGLNNEEDMVPVVAFKERRSLRTLTGLDEIQTHQRAGETWAAGHVRAFVLRSGNYTKHCQTGVCQKKPDKYIFLLWILPRFTWRKLPQRWNIRQSLPVDITLDLWMSDQNKYACRSLS